MIRRILLGMAASVSLAGAAFGQNTCRSCVDSVSGQWHMLPALGLRAGIPQKASFALGIVTGKNYREKGHTEDLAIYVEPGLSAGRASIGYINGFGNMGSGFGFAATAMRTWKDPINLRTNVTYAGAELWVWPIFFSGPRVGLFRRVSGASHSWFLTADFGFGL
jgi:hypothetical protein